jgi:hypothetical protein
MNRFTRSITVLVAGVLASTALAGSAQAADPVVQIVQKVDSAAGPLTSETAISASSNDFVTTKVRSNVSQQRWIKRQIGQNFFSYENVKFKKCLTAVDNAQSNLKLLPCQIGDGRQMWTQGFSGGDRRKLENLQSSMAATLKQSVSTPNNTTGDVIQQFFNGSNRQLWTVVTIG